MDSEAPKIITDADGIWEFHSGTRMGIAWNDIFAVSAVKLDRVTGVIIVVTLDFSWGEYHEIMDHWPGFAEAVDSITARLPGIDPLWMNRVRAMKLGDTPIAVWQQA